MSIQKVTNLINYAKRRVTSYSGATFPGGYQTIEIDKNLIMGQRNPSIRLSKVPYDFYRKSVLDIGCNEGGMLFFLADRIRWGVGVDNDPNLINIAIKIKSMQRLEYLNFYNMDLDIDPLSLLNDFVSETPIDICLFMSMCKWISKWREALDYISDISNAILMETNGDDDFQKEQINWLSQKYENTIELSDVSDDDIQWPRKLYLAQNI